LACHLARSILVHLHSRVETQRQRQHLLNQQLLLRTIQT
jgi:hypothetical protein